ncbi:MAG TPA: TIGR02996 domain-containing protein [Gemmataceae bacterium]|jgi:uncharacterized protein (TIGR02996 family)
MSVNTRQQLLASICAAPDDIPSRLIFADWLEEFGDADSDRARAEFIRLQCAIENLEQWSPERLDREERAKRLLKEHGEDWQRDLPGWARLRDDVVGGSRFRRGFLERIFGKAEDFFPSAEELFAITPVREVNITLIRDGGKALANCPQLAKMRRLEAAFEESSLDLAAFLDSPYLLGLRELALDYLVPHQSGRFLEYGAMLGDDEAAALARCPRLSGLTALDVGSHAIGPEGLAALVESPHLTRMEQLDLRGNPIGDEGLKRLARSPWCGQLTHLTLYGASIGNAGLGALAAGQPGRLSQLGLGGQSCRIGDAGIRALARCEHLAGLRELELFAWPLSRNRARSLARSPSLAGLRVLRLTSANVGDNQARELAASPHLRCLRFVDLQNNDIGAEGITALARSPVLESLTELVLFNNSRIGDEGVAALAASDFLPHLRTLSLTTTGLGPEGARALAISPNLPQLQFLDLQDNPIGDEGGRALCESPYLGRIRRLSLHTCGIGQEIKDALRERFGEALHIDE